MEYDSNETINTNGLSWFVTYRKGSYRMARVQKGDVLYFARSPDDLPKEEFVRILEGIVPADRETAELNWEVDNYEEAKEILSGEQE